MEINEILISIESSLTNLFYNNEFDYITFYTNLHNYSIQLQKVKYSNIREDMITFYNAILTKFTSIIDGFISNIFNKINNDNEKLKMYNYELIIYNNNLEIIDKISAYITNQLINYDINKTDVNYINYGKEKWINGVTINLSKYITDKIIYNINFYNLENTIENNNEEIYYITEILDNLYNVYNNGNNVKFIKSNFTDVIENHLNKNVNNLLQVLHNITDFLITIDSFNTHYIVHLNKLNLNYLIGKYNNLFKTLVLDKYQPHIKIEFRNILNLIDFNKFKLTNTIDEKHIKILNICIKYCDPLYAKNIYYNWIYDLYKNSSSLDNELLFEYICYLKYFSNTIYEKINKYYTNLSENNIFNVDNIFNQYFTDDKSIIDEIDIYIRTNCYKGKGMSVKSFSSIIAWYLNKFIDDDDYEETLYVHYKSYNVKRLYKFNFYKKYVAIELEILNYLINNIKSQHMHKLTIIKNDICDSKQLSLEFNNIYTHNSNLTIITYGIWGISPSTYNYSNEEFKNKVNTLTQEVDLFYNYKVSNRQLIWCHDICSCKLNYSINNQIIEIECPLNYANMLYNFNNTDNITNINNKLLDNLVTYKLLIKDNNTYILNNKFKAKNNKLIIRNSQSTSKKIQKKHNNEIVFTQKEFIELYVMRTLKAQKELPTQELLDLVKIKYTIEDDLIINILNELVEKTYLSIENNNYLYVI